MKPLNVKPSTHIDFSKKINYLDPKFKIGDISGKVKLYKNIFVKSYVSNCSEEVFMIKKLHCTMRHGALHHGDML